MCISHNKKDTTTSIEKENEKIKTKSSTYISLQMPIRNCKDCPKFMTVETKQLVLPLTEGVNNNSNLETVLNKAMEK